MMRDSLICKTLANNFRFKTRQNNPTMITVSESGGIMRDTDLNQHWMPALNFSLSGNTAVNSRGSVVEATSLVCEHSLL